MNITESFSLDWNELSNEHQEKEYIFKEDPLVLGCVLKEKLIKTKIHQSIDDISLIDHITDDIRKQAETIRKYYSKKYFWSRLKNNQPLSPFRERVLYLLESRVRAVKEKDKGIYYKLPWFYDEDMIYEEFKKKYQTENLPKIDRRVTKSHDRKSIELEYLKSTISTQSKRKTERFWFTDQRYLYGVEIEQSNNLLEMFRSFLVPGKTIKFNTLYQEDYLDRLHFYRLYNFNLEKESNA